MAPGSTSVAVQSALTSSAVDTPLDELVMEMGADGLRGLEELPDKLELQELRLARGTSEHLRDGLGSKPLDQ